MAPRGYTPDGCYPMLPAQFGNNSGLGRGEPSGEILCPRRMAHIAVMRCGEYQNKFNCGEGCAVKAADADLARARAEVVVFTSIAKSLSRRVRGRGL